MRSVKKFRRKCRKPCARNSKKELRFFRFQISSRIQISTKGLDFIAPSSSNESMAVMMADILRDFFNSKKEIEIAILYGSFAKGTETNESDIDLGICLTSPLTAQDKISYIDELSLLTHKTIDLVDLRTIHVPLSQEVFLTGKVLKNKNKNLWEYLVRRMIYEVSDFLPMRRKEQINRIKKFIGNEKP